MNKLNKIFIAIIVIETILLVILSYMFISAYQTLISNAKAARETEARLFEANSKLNNYINKYDYGMDVEL